MEEACAWVKESYTVRSPWEGAGRGLSMLRTGLGLPGAALLEFQLWRPSMLYPSANYTSIRFSNMLADNGITQSMGNVGDSYDNALMENFWSTLKVELIYRRRWDSVEQLDTELFLYIDGFYNTRRIQKRLGYRSPAQLEEAGREGVLTEHDLIPHFRSKESYTHKPSISLSNKTGVPQVARVAVTLLVFDRTDSAVLTALTYALTYLPPLLTAPLLAGLADRYSRRAVMVVVDLLRAVLIGLMAIPGLPLWVLAVLLVAVTCPQPLLSAARVATVPKTLPGNLFSVGMSIIASIDQIAQIAGFALGGLVWLVGFFVVAEALAAPYAAEIGAGEEAPAATEDETGEPETEVPTQGETGTRTAT